MFSVRDVYLNISKNKVSSKMNKQFIERYTELCLSLLWGLLYFQLFVQHKNSQKKSDKCHKKQIHQTIKYCYCVAFTPRDLIQIINKCDHRLFTNSTLVLGPNHMVVYMYINIHNDRDYICGSNNYTGRPLIPTSDVSITRPVYNI